jgi:hypothetical protein
VLIIVGLVIVLIYKPRRHGSEPPPPPESSTSPDSGNIPAASGISRPIPGQDNEPESEPDKATQPRPTDDPEDYRRSRVRRRVRP